MHCCGVEGPKDYYSNIPGSCCKKDKDMTCSASESFSDGCGEIMYSQIVKFGKILGGIVIGVGVVEVSFLDNHMSHLCLRKVLEKLKKTYLCNIFFYQIIKINRL